MQAVDIDKQRSKVGIEERTDSDCVAIRIKYAKCAPGLKRRVSSYRSVNGLRAF